MWENASTPINQVMSRKQFVDMCLFIGCIFWSAVVGSIASISNLDRIAKDYSWLRRYQDTWAYEMLNNYLAVILLLILLNVLPYLFQYIAQFYEGIKTHSEIQNLVMTRFFYYQLANVYVSMGVGSISASLARAFAQPQSLLRIY